MLVTILLHSIACQNKISAYTLLMAQTLCGFSMPHLLKSVTISSMSRNCCFKYRLWPASEDSR